jgi:hypothetical protein
LGHSPRPFKKTSAPTPTSAPRREALPGTIKFYPLQKNGVTYGAIRSGEHYFYINDSGKTEYRDGRAKFLHL